MRAGSRTWLCGPSRERCTIANAPSSETSCSSRLSSLRGPPHRRRPGRTLAQQRIRLAPEGAQLVSVRTLAYLLWEAVSLCRWHPTWTRDSGRTRYQLLKAAEGYEINGRPADACS